MSFHLGCAVWAYKGWVGDFYPPKSRASQFLSLYSQRFTTVEGNTTFYVEPDRTTIARWATETSPGFRFCLKMPRSFTHNGLLQPAIAGALQFLDRIGGLGDRLGPTFAQLPPDYSPAQIEDLSIFLHALIESKVPLALEVRHRGWFQEPYATRLSELLTSLGIGRVLLDSRPVYAAPGNLKIYASERRKPKLPLQISVTADFALIRFISHPNLELNTTFFQEWVAQINAWLGQNLTVYFFVHCPEEERSPGNARHFQAMLEAANISGNSSVPPLPWNQLELPPAQLALFS